MNQPAMKPDQVINALNQLIELNRDRQNGFIKAAEIIEAPHIKQFCCEQSRSGAHFVGELQPLVLSLGDEPDNTGSVAGALHRGWIDLKSALGGGDHAILVSAEAGEDRAINEYKKVLEKPLPGHVRDIVERQFQSVEQTHDQLKEMRDTLGTASGNTPK